MRTDAVIIGGGPAGLAAAIALRQKGIDCLVIEALRPPIDKACGEGLMPGALLALDKLGVEIRETEGHSFHGIRFVSQAYEVSACFPQGIGMGVRRTRLQQRLAERAQATGAMVLWDSRATLANDGSVAVNGEQVYYRWLIGADGQASTTRQWAGLQKTRKESMRFGFRRHYNLAPWSGYVEVHWGAAGQVYVTPVAADAVCIMLVTRSPARDWENILDSFPEIARRLKGAPLISRERGAVSATRRLNRVANKRAALVGDASGSVDAITGEGLDISFHQAIALADAVEKSDLASYARRHREIGKRAHAMASLMLTMDRRQSIQCRAMEALSSDPSIFSHLLAVHVGSESFYGFALRYGIGFGCRILRPFGAW